MIDPNCYTPPEEARWTGRVDDLDDRDAFRWHQVIEPLDLSAPADQLALQTPRGFCLLGYCCDHGVELNLGRTGAARGPEAIRTQLANLPVNFQDTVGLYDGGDIHRQVVTWKSGAKVYVNRGAEDWQVAGKVLPQYGCFAKSGEVETSIERIGGVIVEHSRGAGRWYVNARTHDPGRPLAIHPEAGKLEYLGGRDFKLAIAWHADEPAPRDLQAFVHFDYHPKGMRGDAIAFQGDLNEYWERVAIVSVEC